MRNGAGRHADFHEEPGRAGRDRARGHGAGQEPDQHREFLARTARRAHRARPAARRRRAGGDGWTHFGHSHFLPAAWCSPSADFPPRFSNSGSRCRSSEVFVIPKISARADARPRHARRHRRGTTSWWGAFPERARRRDDALHLRPSRALRPVVAFFVVQGTADDGQIRSPARHAGTPQAGYRQRRSARPHLRRSRRQRNSLPPYFSSLRPSEKQADLLPRTPRIQLPPPLGLPHRRRIFAGGKLESEGFAHSVVVKCSVAFSPPC